jgi:hypothetical protein
MAEHDIVISSAFRKRIELLLTDTEGTLPGYVARRMTDYAAAPDADQIPLPRARTMAGSLWKIELPDDVQARLESLHPDLDLRQICARALSLGFSETDAAQASVNQPLRLPAALFARLENEARQAGCGVDAILRQAISDYLYGYGDTQMPLGMIGVPAEIAAAIPAAPDQPFHRFGSDIPDGLLDLETQCPLPPTFIERAAALLASAKPEDNVCRTLDQLATIAVCVYLNAAGPLPAPSLRIEDVFNGRSAHTKLHAAARRAPRLGRSAP